MRTGICVICRSNPKKRWLGKRPPEEHNSHGVWMAEVGSHIGSCNNFLNPTDSPMEIDLVTDFCALTPNQFKAPGTRSVGTLEENRILPHRTAVTIRIGPEFYEVARLNGRFRQTMAVGVEDKLEPVGEFEF